MLILIFRNNSDSIIENHLDNDNVFDPYPPIAVLWALCFRTASVPIKLWSVRLIAYLSSHPPQPLEMGSVPISPIPSGFVLFQGVSQNQMVDHHFRDQMATERYPPASSSYVTQKIKPSMASWVKRFGFSLKQHLVFANPLFQYFL